MRRSMTPTARTTRRREFNAAEAVLNAQMCADFSCECQRSMTRGRGLTHCPVHDEAKGGSPDLNVETGDDGSLLVHCHVGCAQDAVVEALKDKDLWPELTRSRRVDAVVNQPARGQLVAEYTYVDREGVPLFVVERYDPKDFRQRLANGSRKGISDAWVLYHLDEVVAAVERRETVYICEGEKDADALRELGVVATTNPGGAGKWDDRYAADLIGVDVVVFQDKDEINPKTGKRAGEEHTRQVAQSLAIAARSVKVIQLPGRGKDVADWLDAGGNKMALEVIVDEAPEYESDVKAIYTPKDLAREYRDIVAKRRTGDPEYIGWLPGFRSMDRDLAYMPGDLWLVAAATGVGKSAMLQSLQRKCPVPSMLFSVEMSRRQLMDRWIAAETRIDSWSIARGALSDDQYQRVMEALDRFERTESELLVDNAGLTTAALESLLRISRVRFGVRIAYVDYAQRLADKDGESEYQRVTRISNNLARIARETGTTIVSAAQVNREGSKKDGAPPLLKDLRDSGYLEQDASVVIGMGRADDSSETNIIVLKNRNGVKGWRIALEFDPLHGQFQEKTSMTRVRDRASGESA